MKRALLFFAVFAGSVASLTALSAHAGERVMCVLTMPTDAGAISTADSTLADGGVACAWGPVKSLAVQCDNPVYYSERWDGGVNNLKQNGVVPATSSDMLIDFDINPDPYRVDLRGQGRHVSLKSVGTSANNCRVGTVERASP